MFKSLTLAKTLFKGGRPMETLECIKTRRSIRKFKEEAVSHDTIEEIIAAASLSPSWKNTQICRHNIVEDKSILNEIADNCVLDFEYNQKNSDAISI